MTSSGYDQLRDVAERAGGFWNEVYDDTFDGMSGVEIEWWNASSPTIILGLLDAHDAAVRERDAAVREVEELRAVVARKNSALRVAEGALGGLVMDTSDDQRLNDDVLAFVRKGLNATTLGVDS